MTTQTPETAIVITDPTDHSQVLVRLPGHIDPDTVQVDFRPDAYGSVWTPAELLANVVGYNGSSPVVEVRHQ